MPRPDFGYHMTEHEGVKLSCRHIAPKLTMHDLERIFAEAEKDWEPADNLRGNPTKWKNNRGIFAVAEAILAAIYPE